MNNPDTMAIMVTHDTGQRRTKQNIAKSHIILKRWATRNPPKQIGLNPGA